MNHKLKINSKSYKNKKKKFFFIKRSPFEISDENKIAIFKEII